MVDQPQQHDNHPITTLKRRNSLPSAVIVPPRKPKQINGNHHNTTNRSPPLPPSFSAADFELFPLKSPPPLPSSDNYTSLRDILPCSSPSSILSPTPAVALAGISSSSCGSGYEISIKNRLVKQAAWAYLQPTVSTSPSSSSRRLCFPGGFFRPMFVSFRRTVSDTVTRVYDWLVDALWLILCR
ncbi:uncharacterized protein LOC110731057 [Chenopodium quinoa]|uniref:Uncharacterized protein n=1 Tax=Chenopodium quinoa TaxID=63459 RepID=A0A803MXV8_CHEQI|nr:uncharacterized protein LOC110731057 [Chenopodium quinoa]